MQRRFIIAASLVAMLAACNGRNGNGSPETFPPADTTSPRSTGNVTTVALGRPGDRWLDTMQYQIVARGARGNAFGYEVTYEVPGVAAFTLFWSRDQIDFRGALPGARPMTMRLGDGLLHYPEKVTAESLPDVYQAIQLIENGYARDANGMITAAEAFALIATLGVGTPPLRALPPASRAPVIAVSKPAGVRPAPAGAPGAQAARGTGTVWDAVKATQPVYPGTVIPRSFELTTRSGRVWVHGNATKHLEEYARSMLNRGVIHKLVNIGSQKQLQSLQAAIETATVGGVPYGRLITIGGWELKFAAPRAASDLPALIHAVPR